MGYQSTGDGQFAARASAYQDYFEYTFAAADVASMWWQPWLKGVGRSHLELASMQSRNARAWLQWGRDLTMARSPVDLFAANIRLCETIRDHIGETIPKVSGALSQAAQPPAAFDLIAIPAPRRRDALEIRGLDDVDTEERRVA